MLLGGRSALCSRQMRWMAPAHGIWVPKCEGHQAFTSKMGAIRYADYHDRPRLAPRAFFRSTALMRPVRLWFVSRFGGRRCCHFSPSCPLAWSAVEACGTSHFLGSGELIKLGHEVRLMPPAYVKPYVKRGKTDAADAEAVCEAVTRPTMQLVPIKSPEQQAALSIHRTRDLLVKQVTQLINMIRSLLAEVGIDIYKGLERALLMARQIIDGRSTGCATRSCQDRRYIVTAGARHPRSAPRDRPRSHHLATWQRCCTWSHDDPRYRADGRDGSCSIGYRSA